MINGFHRDISLYCVLLDCDKSEKDSHSLEFKLWLCGLGLGQISLVFLSECDP